MKVGVVTHGVAAFIRALDDVTDTTVIANPKMLVLNRQKADLLVGGKQGYLSSTSTDTSTPRTNGAQNTNVPNTNRPAWRMAILRDGKVNPSFQPFGPPARGT